MSWSALRDQGVSAYQEQLKEEKRREKATVKKTSRKKSTKKTIRNKTEPREDIEPSRETILKGLKPPITFIRGLAELLAGAYVRGNRVKATLVIQIGMQVVLEEDLLGMAKSAKEKARIKSKIGMLNTLMHQVRKGKNPTYGQVREIMKKINA